LIRKLSRELENRSLKGIYVPEIFQQELRSLVRTRHQLIRKQSRIKNQIKGYLTFYGDKYPDHYQMGHWSGSFIKYLQSLDFAYEPGKERLKIYLDELLTIRGLLTKIINLLREYCRKFNINDTILLLCSVPGVGFTTAVSIYTEVIDMKRMRKQKTIIKITRKLLNRIRIVWKNEKEYKISVK